MRLGGQVFLEQHNPEAWAQALLNAGFTATVCPFQSLEEKDAKYYVAEAKKHNIVIAEVGAWSNPISPNEKQRKEALQYCKEKLALANEIGAGVCVNIAGSRAEKWDAPHPDNFNGDTFALIVDSVRDIIDSVKPTQTFYALEMMPWVYPYSVDTYYTLLKAIDRPAFAVHFDPVNIVNTPLTYYHTEQLITDFIHKLGPYIKNVHAKDIKLQDKLTVHLDEVIPGEGNLNYEVLLTQLSKLTYDVPIIIEHLHNNEDVSKAATYIRSVANKLNLSI